MTGFRWELTEVLITVIECAIYFLFLTRMYSSKIQIGKCFAIIIVFMSTVIMIFDILNVEMSTKLFCIILIESVLTFILFSVNIKEVVVTQIIWAIDLVISDGISVGGMMFFYNKYDIGVLVAHNSIRLKMSLLSKLFNLVLIILFGKILDRDKSYYSIKETFIILCQGLSSMLCLLMIIEFSYFEIVHNKYNYLILTTLSLLILSSHIGFYLLFVRYVKSRQKEQDLLKVKIYAEKQFEYYKSLEKEQLKIKKIRHDIKDHLSSVQGLMKTDKNMAGEYIEKCMESVKESESFFDTGNPIANIILHEKVKEAQVKNIEMDISIEAGCFDFLDMVDMCCILSNALNNAIEACEKVKNERVIRLRALHNGTALIVRIDNSVEQLPKIKNGNLVSYKKDKENHGIGITSIRMTVEHYQGEVAFEMDDKKKRFTLVVMVPGKRKV